MTIKDLQPRMGKVDVVVVISEKGEIREFEKFGKKGRVCNAKASDATGEIKLSLWNEQIDQVKEGDTVHVTNGYVNEYQGEMQLTTGKFGKLEVTGNASVQEQKAAEEEKVYTNASPEEFKEEAKEMEEISQVGEEVSEEPIEDEEYIG